MQLCYCLKDDVDHWVYEELALRTLVSNFYSSLYSSAGHSNFIFATRSSFPDILMQDLELLS